MIQAACSQTGSKLPVKIATRLAIFSATRRDKRLQRDHVVNSFADMVKPCFEHAPASSEGNGSSFPLCLLTVLED
jgi:hypothetical protein